MITVYYIKVSPSLEEDELNIWKKQKKRAARRF